MLLSILLSVEPAPDSLFGRWEVWEYFQEADTTPLPEEPQGYDLKLGNHIALQDTWYHVYRKGSKKYHGGTPYMLIKGKLFLEDIDSIVLFVKCNFSCYAGGRGITRTGMGKLRPLYNFPGGTDGWRRVVLRPAGMYDVDTTDTTFEGRYKAEYYLLYRHRYPDGMVEVVIGAIKRKEPGIYYVRFEVSPLYVYLKKEEER